MKKIFFALFAVAFVFALCFAQQSPDSSASTSPSTPPVSQPETKFFTGKVNAVSAGNADEGTKPQVTVTDDNGQNLTFVIDTGALIADKDGNVLASSDIKSDSKVTVSYIVDEDSTNKAESIKAIE